MNIVVNVIVNSYTKQSESNGVRCVCDFVLVEIRRNSITLSGTGTNMFVLKRLKCQTINITSNIDCNKSKTRGEFRNFVSIYERGIEKNIKLLVNHSLE